MPKATRMSLVGLSLAVTFFSPWACHVALAQETPPTYIGSWGGPGYGPGQLVAPRSMAMDQQGNLYVSDGARKDLQRVTPAGQFSTVLNFGFAPWDFAIHPAGYIYAVDPFGSIVYRYTIDGLLVGWWSRPPGTGPGEWGFPIGLAVDHQGFVWVLDATKKRADKFTSAGGYVTGFAVSPGWESPQRLRFDASDNLYVLSSGCHVRKFDYAGQPLGEWGAVGGATVNYPPGIALAPSNHVYVSEPTPGRITKYTLDGGVVASWTTFGPQSLSASANCLAVDASGRLFAAGDLHGTIEVYGNLTTAARRLSWGELKERFR